MSVRGYKGGTLRILREGETLARVRAKTVSHRRDAIDTTDEEGDGWRHIDRKAESKSVELSVEGVSTIDNYHLLRDDWLGNTFSDIAIVHSNGTVEIAEDGAFLRSLNYSGESNGFVAYQATFVLSGLVTFLEEIVLTSRPYSYEFAESMQFGGTARAGAYLPTIIEDMDFSGTCLGGALETPLVEYDVPPEELDFGGTCLGGELDSPLVEYQVAEEELDFSGTCLGGVLDSPLIEYDDWPSEELDLGGTCLSGTLETP